MIPVRACDEISLNKIIYSHLCIVAGAYEPPLAAHKLLIVVNVCMYVHIRLHRYVRTYVCMYVCNLAGEDPGRRVLV